MFFYIKIISKLNNQVQVKIHHRIILNPFDFVKTLLNNLKENPKIARRLKNRSDKMLNTEKVPSTKNSSSYKQTKDNSKQVTQEKEAKQDGYESNKKNGYESDVEDLSEWRSKLLFVGMLTKEM